MSKDKRPMEKSTDESSLLNLAFQSQDGTTLRVAVKPSTIMKQAFKHYCKRKQIIDYKTVRFIFDGKRLSAKMTVEEVGLKDEDHIDAMLQQDGGGSAL